MTKHFVHYVLRNVRVRPPMQQATAVQSTNDFRRPALHKTGAIGGAAARVREGDVIWLVSQLRSPWGMLPAAIDARIEVEEIERSDGQTRFHANERSAWLPLRDATDLLRAATPDEPGAQPLWSDPARPIGQYLQSMRTLGNPASFEAWHADVMAGPAEFVSYRQADGTRHAFETVRCLLSLQRAVFWDRWSMPRGVAERREQAAEGPLDEYLMAALQKADKVWGIASPRYAEAGSYSLREKISAGAKLVMVPPGAPCSA